MANKQALKGALPADTFFYLLPLERGFILTRKTIDDHFGSLLVGYKRMMGTYAHYVSFERELVKLTVHLKDAAENQFIFLHVSPDELAVTCNCGMPGQKLCLHAYCGLRYILGYHGEEADMSRFYWPGISTMDRNKEKFLLVEPHDYYITIKPQKQFGSFYRPDMGFEHFELPELKKRQTGKPLEEDTHKRDVLGYCILFRGRHFKTSLPIIVPFWGTTDRAGKRVVSFKSFLIHNPIPQTIQLSPFQVELNEICKQMWDIESPAELKTQTSTELSARKSKLFDLWKEAFVSLLHGEEHLFINYRMINSIKKYKPTRNCMRDCSIRNSAVDMSFLLTEQEDYFMLESVLADPNGKELKLTNDTPRFFASYPSGYNYYFLPSVQDNDLLEQLYETDNRLTILKRHFAEFEDMYLKPLSECYVITLKRFKSKKKMLYIAGVIASEPLN